MKRHWPKGTWMKLNSPALLRELMKMRGASNADVGRAAGTGRTFISALLNGRRTSCKPETAERIALYFAVPLETLFTPRASSGRGQDVNGKAA